MPGRSIDNGYGKTHRRIRADYARRMAAGEQFSCWRCGNPIDSAADWDLGHDDDDRSAYRGPEHVHCNRSSVKRTSAQLKSVRYRGKVWRRCEICGAEYRPSNWRQRTCGRACGAKLNGRNRKPRPRVTRSCLECGEEFKTWASHPRGTCSARCAGRRKGHRPPKATKPKLKPRSGWQKLLDKNRGG